MDRSWPVFLINWPRKLRRDHRSSFKPIILRFEWSNYQRGWDWQRLKEGGGCLYCTIWYTKPARVALPGAMTTGAERGNWSISHLGTDPIRMLSTIQPLEDIDVSVSMLSVPAGRNSHTMDIKVYLVCTSSGLEVTTMKVWPWKAESGNMEDMLIINDFSGSRSYALCHVRKKEWAEGVKISIWDKRWCRCLPLGTWGCSIWDLRY